MDGVGDGSGGHEYDGGDIGGLTSDEVLARHRQKYEADRQWIQQQTELLRQLQPAAQQQQQHATTGGTTGGNPTPRSAGARSRGGYATSQSPLPVAAQQSSSNSSHPAASSYRAAAGPTYRVSGSALTVHTRASQWQKRRSQKLDELRQQHLEQELAECTFRPVTVGDGSSQQGSARRDRGSPEGGPYTSSTGGIEPSAISGLDEFLQRQDKARQLVQEKLDRLRCDGSKWRPEMTQPEPFQLGVRIAGGPRIRALVPPLLPSEAAAEHFVRGSSEGQQQGSHSPSRRGGQLECPLEHSSIPQGVFSAAISSPGAYFRLGQH